MHLCVNLQWNWPLAHVCLIAGRKIKRLVEEIGELMNDLELTTIF